MSYPIEEKKGNKLSYLPAQYLKSALIIQNATKYSGLDDDNETAITELLRYTPKDQPRRCLPRVPRRIAVIQIAHLHVLPENIF